MEILVRGESNATAPVDGEACDVGTSMTEWPELREQAGVLGDFISVGSLKRELIIDDLHVDEDGVVD